jgi:hypothetical protein
MLAAKTRIIVCGRSRGLSRSKATLCWSRLIRRWGQPDAGAIFDTGRRGESGPFRYGQVADLPVDLVTAAVEFVRAQRPSSGVEVAWLEPDTLRLRSSQPAAELHLRVSVPERK